MGLPEDLKALQDLHDKVQLTDAEYTAAKDATLKKYAQPSAPSGQVKNFGIRTAILILLLTGAVAYFWFQRGSQTTRDLAVAVHAPIQLKDEIENVSASSFKAVGLSLPYAGNLTIDLEVVRGNPMDVFLMSADQIDNLKAQAWDKVRTYAGFNGQKAKTYRRSGRLEQGSYYLVLRDTSLGILSSSSSDISVKAQLNP